MEVTKEMIEAGVAALHREDLTLPSKEFVAKILTAALSASPAVVVKPLEWMERGNQRGTHDAMTTVGNIIASIDELGRGFWFIVGITNTNYVDGGVEAAKSAAFADYSARIMSAIEQDKGA